MTNRTYKILALVLALVLIITGCSVAENEAFVSSSGYSGQILISATADLETGKFTLALTKQSETPGVGDLAAQEMIDRINESQSLGVDVVSGATVSSGAVVSGATDALAKLGYNIDMLSIKVYNAGDVEYISRECDVVIVGAGGAGLLAAIAAAENGAQVLVLEKLGVVGGSTARSDGKIMASETEIQKNNLVSDSNIGFASYLFEYANGMCDSTRVMTLAENSAGNLQKLMDYGVTFSSAVASADNGATASRIHTMRSTEYTGGGLLIQPLLDKCEELGVEIITEAEVYELKTDAIGGVRGVLAVRPNGSILDVSASATVLATGGFDQNGELVNEMCKNAAAISYSGLGSTGSGVTMARDVGALTYDGSLIATLNDFYTGSSGNNGLLVTPDGRRFADESQDGFALFSELAQKGYSYCWRIVDKSNYNSSFDAAIASGNVVSAASLEELAEVIDAPSLVETVERYNKLSADGVDWQFGKDPNFLKAIGSGRVYAIKIEAISYGTIGGVKTNAQCEVQSKYGSIPGLYAAGEVSNGAYFFREFPGFGASLSQVVETGMVAGAEAAQFAAARDPVPVAPTEDDAAEESTS